MGVCAVCRKPAPVEARFCPQCGAHLAEVPEQEERKLVTALFADVVGFTSMSEDLDVEDVRRTLAVYHSLVRHELELVGGTVEKFIGDAVVAIFGAPASHEDDAERAVRAGLAIQQALRERREVDPGFTIRVRVGVNTGEALVALHVNPQAGEGLAAGDVVNTASRLQSVAPIDGVLVGEATYRASNRAIRYRKAEPAILKGKRDPVPVWIAEAADSAGTEMPEVRPPLVGRQAQLDNLWSALCSLRTTHAPRLVTLVGAPGIGKSRLVSEFLARIEADPEQTSWRKGRSLPYGDGVTFWALAEIVKAEAGILHSDDAETAGTKLRRAVVNLTDGAVDADSVLSELRPLVGLDNRQGFGGDRQVEAFAAWRRFIEALARRTPLVLVFEDIHWADDALLDFIEQLLQWTTDTPLLALCTARPEILERRPAWGSTDTLTLPPLSEDETASLVAALLDEMPLPAAAQQALLERAHGNPLYAQEYARMLLDRGLIVRRDGRWALATDEELPLPETVHGIIAARLDALTSDEKAVLQDASVIGKVMWPGAVAHIERRDPSFVHRQLQALRRKQLLRLEQHTSVAAEAQYAFTHALVRDVAYSQIVRSARADKHVRAAEWIESLGDRSDRVELLAHHYVTALELGAASGVADRLPDRARAALLEAADRAFGMSAYAAAARFYRSAFELADVDVPPLLRYRHAKALMYSEEVLPDDLTSIASQFAESGDLETASEIESEVGLWHDRRGHRQESLIHLLRAVALLESEPPSTAKASGLVSLASVYVLRGRLDEAIEAAVEAGTIATDLGVDDLAAWSHQTLAIAYLQGGDVRGIVEFQRAYAIARHLDSFDGAMIEHNYGVELLALGDLREAQAVQVHAKERARRLGLSFVTRAVNGTLACIHYHPGEWDEARAIAERAIAAAGAANQSDQIDAHSACGRMDLAAGDYESASRHAKAAVRIARASSEPQHFVPSLGLLAQIHVQGGRPAEAAKLLEELLDRWWIGVAICSESLACAAFAARELPGVRETFADATSTYPLPSRWVKAAHLLAIGSSGAAAALYADIGSTPDEALARACSARPTAS
jgi:class 3 adenylate cyclase/tetratricopeptide (TPR) repeat protein